MKQIETKRSNNQREIYYIKCHRPQKTKHSTFKQLTLTNSHSIRNKQYYNPKSIKKPNKFNKVQSKTAQKVLKTTQILISKQIA